MSPKADIVSCNKFNKVNISESYIVGHITKLAISNTAILTPTF